MVLKVAVLLLLENVQYIFSFSEVKSWGFVNSCFVIGQIPFHYFFYLACWDAECSKCLVALMQENSLWGSSLFFTQFSGSQDRQRNAKYPLPSRLVQGDAKAFPSWNMSLSQTLLSCKPNILWCGCEWSSWLQCSYWCHRFYVHEVVILPFVTLQKTMFFTFYL